MKTSYIYSLAVATLLLGVAVGWWIKPQHSPLNENHDHSAGSQEEVWTCSMHPQIRQPEPGACPICGMDLIPLAASDSEDDLSVSMSATAIKLAHVQTTVVKESTPLKETLLTGKVAINESELHKLAAHFHGRIEKLYVNYAGQKIKRGQLLAEVYSPELTTAQQELQLAFRSKDENPKLYRSARQKLAYWKITEAEINKIEKADKPFYLLKIHAHHGGTVISRKVAQGDHVRMGDILFETSNLRRVWVQLDVYESDLPWIKAGDSVSMQPHALPGKTFSGNVQFIDPVINATTRTARARVEVLNTNQILKPEMFVSATISSNLPAPSDGIAIPKSAVLWTGKRSVVYVKKQDSNKALFSLREVILGPDMGDKYLITDGLKTGEEVVINGAFQIDAAAQLAGKPSMMSLPPARKITAETKAIGRAISPLLETYFELKDALVNDDFTLAKNSAEKMLLELKKVKNQTKQYAEWAPQQKGLEKHVKQTSASSTLEDMREGFIALSEKVIEMQQSYPSATRTAYVLHCPMADSNEGADWLSKEKEIRNPYFGASMLKCGEVKKEIAPVKE